MVRERLLLVKVEPENDETLVKFALKIFLDMDKHGIYVVSVKEITI